MPAFIVAMVTVTFSAILVGTTQEERVIPAFRAGETPACTGDRFVDGILCAVNYTADFFRVIGGVVIFFINAATVNVNGAPWYARLIIGSMIGGSLLIAIAQFFRGN